MTIYFTVVPWYNRHLLATKQQNKTTVYAIWQVQKHRLKSTLINIKDTKPRRWHIQIKPRINNTNSKTTIKAKLKPKLKLCKVNIIMQIHI